LWAGGKKEQIDTRTASGREIWQQEFDLTEKAPGKYNVLIRAKDAAGNTAESGPFNIRIDPNAGLPVARVVYPEPNAFLRQDIKLIGVASGRFGVSRVLVRLDDGDYRPADGTDYWSRIYDVGALNEGRHTIFVQAYDSKDTAGPESSVSFTIDKTPPAVELLSHKTGDIISGNITITGQSDDVNGIAAMALSVGTGNAFMPLSFKTKKGESAVNFSYPVKTKAMEDGPVVFYIRSEDKTGYSVVKPYLFFVDNHGPELEILSPSADEDMYTREIITGRIADVVGLEKFYYEWNGTTADITLRPGDPFWNVELDFSEPKSVSSPLKITAVDKSGNTTVLTRRFKDKRKMKVPGMVIDYPPPSGLNALPQDASIYGRIVPGFFPEAVIIEGSDCELPAMPSFRIPPELIPQGRSAVKIVARSKDGLLSAPLSVRVNKPPFSTAPRADGTIPIAPDMTPSAITVFSPTPYSWLANSFELNGRVSAASGARLEYRLYPEDGWRPLPLGDDGFFRSTISLSQLDEGPVHMELRTVRGGIENLPFYHPLNKSVTVPELSFIVPSAGLGSVHGLVSVTGAVSHYAPLQNLSYSLDGVNYAPLPYLLKQGVSTFTLGCDFTALNNTGNRLVVRATDAAGAIAEKSPAAVFNSGTDLPALIVNSPSDKQIITGDLDISGIAFDDDAVAAVYWRLFMPSLEAAEAEPEFTKIATSLSFQANVAFSSLVDGEYTLEIYAEDMYGVKGDTIARTVRVSTAAPEILVTEPALDFYNRRTIVIRGSAADKNGIEEVLVSMDNGNSYQKAEGGEEWSLVLNTAAYNDGVYSLLIRVVDKYGISAVSNALINIDNTPPSITLGTPANGQMAGADLLVSGQANDNMALTRLSIQLVNLRDSSRKIAYDLPIEFVIMESVDISGLAAGEYNLTLAAVDRAGNEAIVTRAVYISLENTASEVTLFNPMPGETCSGPLFISGKVSGAVIPKTVDLMVNRERFSSIEINRYGVFYYAYPEERLGRGESLIVSVSYDSPSGEKVESNEHEILVSPYGPALTVESHNDGDIITGRPWLSGRAWIALPEPGENEDPLTRQRKKETAVTGVEVSLDNGRSFAEAQGRENWKFRLETGDLGVGTLPVIVRAAFADGRSAVRRIILAVDIRAPQVETLEPAENSTHRDSLTVYGSSGDDFDIDSVEVSLRPGDKAGYAVPGFIQGLYFDANFLGATIYTAGLGLSFFDNNVKLQFQAGLTPPAQRFSGVVVGAKLLANVFYLPFDYIFGPDWSLFSTAFALGANFSYFSMEEDENSLMMGAFLAQWEFFRVDMSYVFPKWEYFKSLSLYMEPVFWFASSDIQAGAIFRISLGARVSLF
jgi:hypothetical protein